jgi:beta-phosphoglucomutase-like phosphatase (HAD superfamily)
MEFDLGFANIFLIYLVDAGWKESFSVIVGGDEVEKGKPSPDL